MMFINAIIVFILLVIIKIYLEGQNSEITYVQSSRDGHMYLVRNLPDKEVAADNISKIKEKLNTVVNHLKTKYPESADIKRLVDNWRQDALGEAPVDSKHTSYSINKGEKIYFCLRQRDDNNNLVDLNTVTFVALHELAHVMTKSVGHTKEFWDNFRFILKHAIDINVYEYQPFHTTPIKYCGTIISDTPLKI